MLSNRVDRGFTRDITTISFYTFSRSGDRGVGFGVILPFRASTVEISKFRMLRSFQGNGSVETTANYNFGSHLGWSTVSFSESFADYNYRKAKIRTISG
ncbi:MULTISPECIES: hypothetical protein [unclassified Tolypothrix]|uniref:hypothetical protein n=1 Tax=unclassified Tolypothrix TaxID=2649714 RepID=UPI0012D731B4|nr:MULTISPECIES: hypothetical protein [unclassified Tolypothrix]MBE9082040.1 hypothetical protein [Tolypothrix sp. LEGE 11397]UYD24989.1 hypothetical protein HGR01_26810 [Tolypothrix sp. PCC 7712]UYD32775.1 hypothetical protein HG267_27820 [Tolypothrix sp. PCC 7601]